MKRGEPDFGRFLAAVIHVQEPDRVPFVELFHDYEVMVAVSGAPASDSLDDLAQWRVSFWRELGYDYISAGVDLAFAHGQRAAADTAVLNRGQRGWIDEGQGVVADWDGFERYDWPEVTPAAFATLEALGRHLPDGMKVTATIPGGVLENILFMMGLETFSYALLDQPDLVTAVADRVGSILERIVETTASMEFVGAQWLNDDMGFKGGTIVSPEALRRLIFPVHQRICDIVHAQGKPVLLHSCGKLDAVMDELISDVGIDAKHSFEDAIMPVWEAKPIWGDRIGLLGGVDMDVLARGSEDQVRAYTRRCIERCAPGGGWALGSGNSIANYVPVANFRAMLDEGWRCGRYS